MTGNVVVPAPDPARDARVAARRAADARRAGRALDRLIGEMGLPEMTGWQRELVQTAFVLGRTSTPGHHCQTCTCNDAE